MKNKLYLLFLLVTQVLLGQVFPVQVTSQLIPPHSLTIPEYTNANREQLILNLLLTDISELNRAVTLRFSLTSTAGFSVQSAPVVIGALPINLNGGVPLRLTNADLQSYFEFQNLTGISPDAYGRSLPDGLYQFCFEVFDGLSGRPISRQSCATAFLVLNDPPFLNTPSKGEIIAEQNPQNIIFQWTPRHLNATNVEYEFTLVELWDELQDPQASFLAGVPYYQTSTRATTLLYGPGEPGLLADKRYAWRIRAIISDGISQASVFKNDGYSEIYYFDYNGECLPPQFALTIPKTKNTQTVQWGGGDYLEYNLQYRKLDGVSNEWFSVPSKTEQANILNLEESTTYEYRVGGQCRLNGGFSYGNISEFTTAESDDTAAGYECGILPDIQITNQEPLTSLVVNDVFTAGDFPVKVKYVGSGNRKSSVIGSGDPASGANGSFSGEGYITVPYLADTRIKVIFDNVKINSDYQLIDGIVDTDYNPENLDSLSSVDEFLEVFEGDNDLRNIEIDFDITIEDIKVNEDGSVTVTNPNGNEKPNFAAGDDIIIQDASGDIFIVDKEGNITEGGQVAEGGGVNTENTPNIGKDGSITQLSAEGIKVTFISDSSYLYGFDEIPNWQENHLADSYTATKDIDGNPYKIIHKAIANSASDKLKAEVEITDDSIKITDLVIKTASGQNIEYTVSGNTLVLDLKGYFAYENENVYATIQPDNSNEKQTIAGVFKLWHLTDKPVNVTIIPVKGVSLPSETDLKEQINKIYGKAAVTINLQIASEFEVDPSLYGNDTLLMGDSGIFQNYTNEQSAVINAYKSDNSTSLENYYLFALGSNIQPSRSNVAGFMPISRQFGFVFTDNISEEEEGKNSLAGTIAHELGHGAFKLEHPFTQHGTTQGATNWLLDYGNGTELSHMDWMQIHNPDFKLYFFQDAEDGESKNSNRSNQEVVDAILTAIKGAYNGIELDFPWKQHLESNCEKPNINPGTLPDLHACQLEGNYIFNFEGEEFKFGLNRVPFILKEKIKVLKDTEKLKIEKRKFLGVGGVSDIYYLLKLYDEEGEEQFVFEFGHHDQIEAFCRKLGIEGVNENPDYQEVVVTEEEQVALGIPVGTTVEEFKELKVQNQLEVNDSEVVVDENGQTEISKTIIRYLDGKFLPNSLTACNDIDLYFSEIPDFHINKTMSKDQLWSVLEVLLSCNVDDSGVNEEVAVITIIKALAINAEDAFLKGLFEKNIEEKTVFRKLFEKIDDWGGDDNFTTYINEMQKIWEASRYFKEVDEDKIEAIPYKSTKSFGFYLGNYAMNYSDSYEEIEIFEDNYDPNAGVDSNNSGRNYTALGEFKSYDPIRLVDYKDIKSELKLDSKIIPMFVLKALETKNKTKNIERGTILALDIGTTFLTIGHIAKLRHLRIVHGVNVNTRITIASVELTASVLGILLDLASDEICSSESCKKLRTFLLVVELASLGTDLVYTQKLKSSADDVLAVMDDLPENYTKNDGKDVKVDKEEIKKELEKFSSGSNLTDGLLDVINTKGFKFTDNLDFTGYGFKTKDNYADIIIHSDNKGNFILKAEGESDNPVLSNTSLANLMNKIDADKQVRLLSCNSDEAALELSKYTNREFYASDGVVEIYEDGIISHASSFKKYKSGTRDDLDEIPPNTQKGEGVGLRLGVSSTGGTAKYKFEEKGYVYEIVKNIKKQPSETTFTHFLIKNDEQPIVIGTSRYEYETISNDFYVRDDLKGLGASRAMYDGLFKSDVVISKIEADLIGDNLTAFNQIYNKNEGNAIDAILKTPSGKVLGKNWEPEKIDIGHNSDGKADEVLFNWARKSDDSNVVKGLLDAINTKGFKFTDNLDFTDYGFKTEDNYVDIIIHSDNKGNFILKAEGESGNPVLSNTSLTSLMDKIDANKQVRLLSCNSDEVALELSKYTNREFYASDGVVEIYKDGTIAHASSFKKYKNGTRDDLDEIPPNTQKGEGIGLKLGLNQSIENLNFFTKLDELNLEVLKDHLGNLDDASKTKFIDEFKNEPDNVLKFFNDEEALKSRELALSKYTNVSKDTPDISLNEATAILHYSRKFYRTLNTALRSGGALTDELNAFNNLMISGMNKLPKYEGDIVYKGLSKTASAIAKTWKKGEEVTINAFESTSFNKVMAEGFLDDLGGDVMYEILNPRGNDISKISFNNGEDEILFKSNSKFKVEEIHDDFTFYDSLDPDDVLAVGRKVVLRLLDDSINATKVNNTGNVSSVVDIVKTGGNLLDAINTKGFKFTDNLDFSGYKFKTYGDNYVDIIIHSDNKGNFILKAEGQSDNPVLSNASLASLMDKIDANKQVRLLSCNSDEAALELSKYTNREFYASDGVVEIYEDGIITNASSFKKYKSGTRDDLDEIPPNTQKGKGVGLRLGVDTALNQSIEKLVKLVDDDVSKATLRSDLNASSELLKALENNPELVDAWDFAFSCKNCRVITNNLENIDEFKSLTSNSEAAIKYIKKKLDIRSSNRKQKMIDEEFSNPITDGNKKLYGKYEPHEVKQTSKVMDRVEANSSFQPNSEVGIEGLLYKSTGDYIPISLKRFDQTTKPSKVVSKIKTNAGQIQNNMSEFADAVKLGNPNTILDVELPLITKPDMLSHLNANPGTLNLQTKTFKEIVIDCSDGGIIKIDEFGNIIN